MILVDVAKNPLLKLLNIPTKPLRFTHFRRKGQNDKKEKDRKNLVQDCELKQLIIATMYCKRNPFDDKNIKKDVFQN